MAHRDRAKDDVWRRMIRQQARSGLSVRAWCGRYDVSEASFYMVALRLRARLEALLSASFFRIYWRM